MTPSATVSMYIVFLNADTYYWYGHRVNCLQPGTGDLWGDVLSLALIGRVLFQDDAHTIFSPKYRLWFLTPWKNSWRRNVFLYVANFATSCFLYSANHEVLFLLLPGCPEAITMTLFSGRPFWFRFPHFQQMTIISFPWMILISYPCMPSIWSTSLVYSVTVMTLSLHSRTMITLVIYCHSGGKGQFQCSSGYSKG